MDSIRTPYHVVKYVESERGWGSETWFRGFPSEKEALQEVEACNKDLPQETPDYYILASYVGEMDYVPPGFKS